MASAAERTARVERELFLRTIGAGWLSASSTAALADAMEDVFVAAGSPIYRQGDDAHIYFVSRGELHLVAEGAAPWVFKDRSVVGMIDVMMERPHARTAIAITDLHAQKIHGDDYFEIIEDNFEDTRHSIVGGANNLHALCCDLAPDGGFLDPPAGDAPPLGRRLGLVERLTLLSESEIFARAGVQALVSLATIASEVHLDPGEPLFEPDTAGRELYLVAGGVIEATSDAPVAMRMRHGRGSLVCGFGSIAGQQRRFMARAEGPATVLLVRHEDLFDVMEEHFRLARSTFAAISSVRERLLAEKGRRAEQQAGGRADGRPVTGP